MRFSCITIVLAAGLGLISCNRRDNEPAARQAERDAYHASQEIKREAKKVEQDLRKAARSCARAGTNPMNQT